MREQFLDAYGIECGILGPLGLTGQSEFNLDFAGAVASAARTVKCSASPTNASARGWPTPACSRRQ